MAHLSLLVRFASLVLEQLYLWHGTSEVVKCVVKDGKSQPERDEEANG